MTQRTPSVFLGAVLLAGILAFGNASAYTLEEYRFEDPAEFETFRDLIAKLRCLVCQNESLASSQAGVAQDLRNEVYRMMQEGQSDKEIIRFLVDRYGDFVLYEPPVKPSTYILWFGPFIFLGLGGYLLFRALGRKKKEPEEDLTEAERVRLQRLLAADPNNQDNKIK
jgi:cytochrome c-type biogenesis protein CcmH